MNPALMDTISDILGLVIQTGSIIALLYTLAKFMGTPNRTQNERLSSLEDWREEVDRRLESGRNHFDSIDDGNAYILGALLALMDAQISGDNISELQTQKNRINEYLVGRKQRGDSHD